MGLTLPLRVIFSASRAFCISIVIALSTLPDDSFLCDFCKWSLSEPLLRPALSPQMGQTFISGFRLCHSMETFPCSCRSRSNKTFAKPSLGWARRWARLRAFHASSRVNFLHQEETAQFTVFMIIHSRHSIIRMFDDKSFHVQFFYMKNLVIFTYFLSIK